MTHVWASADTYSANAKARDVKGGESGRSSTLTSVIAGSGVGGTLRGRYPTGGGVSSSPVIGPAGTVDVESEDNDLYALDGSTGLARSPWPMFRHDVRPSGQTGGREKERKA